MPHDVVHKVFFPSEAFLADVTAVRSLARVFTHVVDHVFFARERFGAKLTSVEQECVKDCAK